MGTEDKPHLVRVNFRKSWVLDHLVDGTLDVFNRHYDDYSLARCETALLHDDIMDFVTIVHLKDFDTKYWSKGLRQLQNNPINSRGNIFFDFHVGFDILPGHSHFTTHAVLDQLC